MCGGGEAWKQINCWESKEFVSRSWKLLITLFIMAERGRRGGVGGHRNIVQRKRVG